jgi:aldose 1-epimerase
VVPAPDAPAVAAGAPQGAPAPAQPNRGFVAFEPMVAITNALNLAQKGTYKDLQTIPPGGSWEESFWVRAKGY